MSVDVLAPLLVMFPCVHLQRHNNTINGRMARLEQAMGLPIQHDTGSATGRASFMDHSAVRSFTDSNGSQGPAFVQRTNSGGPEPKRQSVSAMKRPSSVTEMKRVSISTAGASRVGSASK